MKYLNENHYKAIKLLLEGEKNQEIAEVLGVHRNSITNWLKATCFKPSYVKQLLVIKSK
ncbi:UNVERIFIED_ORG: transposase [Bacillus sp. 1751]|nr:transposase [Bacillus sp. 1751]